MTQVQLSGPPLAGLGFRLYRGKDDHTAYRKALA